jgi:hypothetical protein
MGKDWILLALQEAEKRLKRLEDAVFCKDTGSVGRDGVEPCGAKKDELVCENMSDEWHTKTRYGRYS